jgi:hypothetical protein
MKKMLLLIPVSLIVLIACNNDSKTTEENKDTAAAPAPVVEDVTQNPAYKAGLSSWEYFTVDIYKRSFVSTETEYRMG